jgi:hypothetical protein
MALYPEWQDKLAAEAQVMEACDFAVMSKLRLSRDVFRETLRLYPPPCANDGAGSSLS